MMEEAVQRVNSQHVCLHRRYRVIRSAAEKSLMELEIARGYWAWFLETAV